MPACASSSTAARAVWNDPPSSVWTLRAVRTGASGNWPSSRAAAECARAALSSQDGAEQAPDAPVEMRPAVEAMSAAGRSEPPGEG